MCYFKTLSSTRDEVRLIVTSGSWGIELEGDIPEEVRPNWRESIGQQVPIIVPVDGSSTNVRVVMARWGVLMDRPYNKTLGNARSGKLSGWPWNQCRPCGVPSDGFYEPEKPQGSKIRAPWSYYRLGEGRTFVMAGVWREGVDPTTGEIIPSFAVVTVDANETVAARKHNRMPAILRDEDVQEWLFSPPYATHLLNPYSATEMSGWRVGDETKSGKAPNGPNMIEPVDDGPQGSFL
ncbi:MAG: SOS response-associated peptidase family protein [Pseudomonadota bacterium]